MDFIKPALAQTQPKADLGTEFPLAWGSLGAFTSALLPLAFTIAAIMVSFYFIIAAFELITSQGDKAHIVSARSKIYHSLIGFILLIVLFLVMQYILPQLGVKGLNLI